MISASLFGRDADNRIIASTADCKAGKSAVIYLIQHPRKAHQPPFHHREDINCSHGFKDNTKAKGTYDYWRCCRKQRGRKM